jgi:RNA-binding protein Musashi
MFIGGLNWDTTDGILVYTVCQPAHPGAKVAISEGLRNYFSQFGKVEACTIMRDAGGRSRCFAFLTFEDPASVNAVMVREHFLDGKIVSIIDHLDRSPTFSHLGHPQIDPKRAIPRQEHQRATKLFIGGLAGSVTSESMREFFSQFGRVVDSTVMLDRETGRSKGFGFVSLENADVDSILGFGKLEIDGKLASPFRSAPPRGLVLTGGIYRSTSNSPSLDQRETERLTLLLMVATLVSPETRGDLVVKASLATWAPCKTPREVATRPSTPTPWPRCGRACSSKWEVA